MYLDAHDSRAFRGKASCTASDQKPREWAEECLAGDVNANQDHSDILQEEEAVAIDHQHIENEIKRLVHTVNIIDGFCGKCRHLLQHWPDSPATGYSGIKLRSLDLSSLSEIEAATSAGCKFCAFIRSRLVETRQLDTFRKAESRLRALGHNTATPLTIQYYVGSQSMRLDLPGEEGYHGGNPTDRASEFECRPTKPLSTLWQEQPNVYELVRMWLRQCDISHEKCRRKKDYDRPTRLVSFKGGVARVVHTETLHYMPQYATLSYCWGSEPFIMLTRDTMKSFFEGITTSNLPETFRDAIHVAEELGLSYIWIDALCIIQHDTEDWSKESGLMRSVYGNSYVNIAAASATSVHQGLFSRPEHYKNYNGGFCARVSTDKHSEVRNFHGCTVYEESTTNTYLATRAWTLQERLLPSRTLFFGNTGVFWECRTEIKSEFLPYGFPGLLGSHLVCPEDRPWDWGQIIFHYSRSNLTDPEDQLPALAGIARRHHEATGHQYLAGMWRESLVFYLPWLVRERKRRGTWRAPSWSWMAVDSQVLVSGETFNPEKNGGKAYIDVLDAWTAPSSPDPFGKVSDGLLSLACSALVRAQPSNCSKFEQVPDAHKTAHCQMVEVGAAHTNFSVSLDVLDDEWSNHEVYLLPVYGGPSGAWRGKLPNGKGDQDQDAKAHEDKEHKDKENNPSDNWAGEWDAHMQIAGIVLRACGQNTGHGGRFARIGSFYLDNFEIDPMIRREPDRDYYHEFIRVLDEQRHGVAGATGSRVSGRADYSQHLVNIMIE